jgi:hypothetical protein
MGMVEEEFHKLLGSSQKQRFGLPCIGCCKSGSVKTRNFRGNLPIATTNRGIHVVAGASWGNGNTATSTCGCASTRAVLEATKRRT